jgi:hypothetical protein
MSRHVEEILGQPGLLRRRWSKHVRLSDIYGLDPAMLATLPDEASVIAMDEVRFRKLPEEEKRSLIEAGFGVCDCSIWSTEALDEVSLSDLVTAPHKQHKPLRVLPDYYVVMYQQGTKTRYLPLRKVMRKHEPSH